MYLLRKFPGFKLTARMTTFLYPVVRNLSIAARRKARRFASDQDLIAHVPVESQDCGGDTRVELAVVMSALPPGQLEVVLMRFVDGMTMSEIALALNLPEGTVKSRLHLASSQVDPVHRIARVAQCLENLVAVFGRVGGYAHHRPDALCNERADQGIDVLHVLVPLAL